MPFKKCLRLDNDQSFTPIKEPGEQDHEGACSSSRTSRFHQAFLKQSELFAKEQVLGDEGGAGGKEQADEQEQATFYRSLQDHLRPSERSDLFFAEDRVSLFTQPFLVADAIAPSGVTKDVVESRSILGEAPGDYIATIELFDETTKSSTKLDIEFTVVPNRTDNPRKGL